MKEFHIYLSGPMSNLSFEEQNEWRMQMIRDIKGYEAYGVEKAPVFFNPVFYYNFEDQNYKSEREVMEFDLNRLRKSDLVIVNFNRTDSLGTAMELAVANELRIPVVGLNEGEKPLHPWLKCCVSRMCGSKAELVEHVVDFYLN